MAEREGGVPRGSSRTLGDPPWGSLSAKEGPPENLEEVPRIWEGEGSWRSEIMNASNNDYWVIMNASKNVVLFEENSILLLPESLESSEW